MELYSLIIPSFIAGTLTFLAPCTFPLIPGYLGFISGVSLDELQNPRSAPKARRRVFLNGLLYVVGFSTVFVSFGMLFGLGGSALGQYRTLLSQIGGVFIIFFGLYIIGILRLPFLKFLNQDHTYNFVGKLTPGTPLSSLIFGATFAFGWTPCVGPILGSVLTLAAHSAPVLQGGFLLAVFSAGLGLPFLIIAYGISSATGYIRLMNKYLRYFEVIGGILLVLLGILLITDNLAQWITFFYRIEFLNFSWIYDYL